MSKDDERQQYTVAVVAERGRHCFFWPRSGYLSGPAGLDAAMAMVSAQRRNGNAAHVFAIPPAQRAEKGEVNPWFDALT